ncbi:MAG: SIMPL domain-containing protein [Chlamydiae bacterium]|nr:SIMPL domain-containing protein [Chlamydiota bacterium]MBI3276667.1 SIMPL domain-containing protein [Chlamydiota bacterium]
MERTRIFRNSQIIILGLCISAATIVSTLILSKSLMQIKKFTNEVITVTGSAEKKILSDYSVWKVSFSRRAHELTKAFSSLNTDLLRVKTYLLGRGCTEQEIMISQVNTEIIFKRNRRGYSTNKIEGYSLSQTIEIRSWNVQKVMDISRSSTELINEGIEIISNPPEFFYTKLSELKLEMLAQATLDAKDRAEKMIQTTGNKIGKMRSAEMGVFQITPVNSYDVSSWGMNDTSSLEKKVNAVIHAEFGIEE